MGHSDLDPAVHDRRPWNAGQNVGPKRPLRPRDIWAIRFYLDEHKRLRDRALFDLAIDSKLRGCDLVKIRIGDLMSAGSFRDRATVIQQKTGRPVQFENMSEARTSLKAWLDREEAQLDRTRKEGLEALRRAEEEATERDRIRQLADREMDRLALARQGGTTKSAS